MTEVGSSDAVFLTFKQYEELRLRCRDGDTETFSRYFELRSGPIEISGSTGRFTAKQALAAHIASHQTTLTHEQAIRVLFEHIEPLHARQLTVAEIPYDQYIEVQASLERQTIRAPELSDALNEYVHLRCNERLSHISASEQIKNSVRLTS